MNKSGTPKTHILTVNAGSSSIKLALFTAQDLRKVFEMAAQNIGQPSARLITSDSSKVVALKNHAEAAALLLEQVPAQATISAVGHRIVHGGPQYHTAQAATNSVIKELRTLAAFDPEHLPAQLDLVETLQKILPDTLQILCFDTAFHHDLPTRARLLPIPRHFEAKGIRRYGFHGLSYAYIAQELRRVEGVAAANGKVIMAHLGSGASVAALHHGKSIDTTMSMTPTSGIPMSTRSGDLDPGLALYLATTEGYTAERFSHMVNFESGLLGMSGQTADMEKLLELEEHDVRAQETVDLFCYNVTKTIGAFAAALGGLNTVVFTGGMGENAPKIRTRICAGLEFLGVVLDKERNQQNARLISADGASVGIHVIHTDEAVMIAQETSKAVDRGTV